LVIISGCGDKLVDHGEQHTLHQIAPPQQQQIYSLSFRQGELNGEQHVYGPFWSCAVTTKTDGSTNIKKNSAAIAQMSKSTVKNSRLHYFFSPILFLLLLRVALQLKMGLFHSFCHYHCSTGTTESMVKSFLKILSEVTSTTKNHRISNFKPLSFLIHHGKTTFLVAADPA
jgi:hypothetical protein